MFNSSEILSDEEPEECDAIILAALSGESAALRLDATPIDCSRSIEEQRLSREPFVIRSTRRAK